MFKQTLIAAAAIALFATAATPALAQSAGAPPADKAGAPRMYGYELMTPQERQAYMDKMRAAKTPEERTKLRDEHRAEMQQRAKEKGVTLAEPRGPRGPGSAGPRGPGGGRMYGEQLFSQQERDDYRKRMQEAKTPEERTKIRDEARATAQARAKEKGVTLAEPRGPRGPGSGGPRGPGGGRMYGEQLFSQQERDDYRKRMHEAKTPEERTKIRDEAHAQAQARAKEKGITLPEPRGPGGPGGGPRGGPGGGRMYGEQLFSQQERDDYRKRMHEAKTPEERTKIRDEVHATAEARAKEKGITLPEPRGPRGPGPGPAPQAPKAQ